jgi:hypothetical protein
MSVCAWAASTQVRRSAIQLVERRVLPKRLLLCRRGLSGCGKTRRRNKRGIQCCVGSAMRHAKSRCSIILPSFFHQPVILARDANRSRFLVLWSTGPELNRRILVLQRRKHQHLQSLTEPNPYSKPLKSTQRKSLLWVENGLASKPKRMPVRSARSELQGADDRAAPCSFNPLARITPPVESAVQDSSRTAGSFAVRQAAPLAVPPPVPVTVSASCA